MAREKPKPKEPPDVGQFLFPMAGVMILTLATMIMDAQSLFSNTSIKVDIPKANVIEVELEQSIPVTVTKEGKLYVQDYEMPDLQAITQKVRELQEKYAAENNDPELMGQQLTVLRADKSIEWGRVLEVLDAVKRGKAKRVALAVVKRKGGG